MPDFPFYPGLPTQPFSVPNPSALLASGLRPQQPPPLAPQEQESLLAQIGARAGQGLGYIGGSLGKAFGGRAVRGLLGGHLDELASIIPFSDTLGITDPTREVRGSDLLGGDKDTSILSPEGVGGFALDVLLDPATYLTFGASALTDAGQAAKKAGTLLSGFKPRIEAGQAGLVGLGLPFQAPSKVFGAGQGGLDFLDAAAGLPRNAARAVGAERLFDPVARAAGSVYNSTIDPLVRGARSLFDPGVMGTTAREAQPIARSAFNQYQKGKANALGNQLDLLNTLAQHDALGSGQAVRVALEGGHGPFQPGIFDTLGPNGQVAQQGAVGLLRPKLDEMQALEQAYGLPTKYRPDYFPRQQTPLPQDSPGFDSSGRQLFSRHHPHMLAREDIFEVPGQTGTVNAIAKDPLVKQMAINDPRGAAEVIQDTHLLDPALQPELKWLRQNPGLSGFVSPEANQMVDQTTRLADWVKNLDPKYAQGSLDFFGNNPATDYLKRNMHHERVMAGTRAFHDLLGQFVHPGGFQDSQPLWNVLVNAGMQEGGTPTQGAWNQILNRIGGLPQGVGLKDLHVPNKIADEATKFVKGLTSPEGFQPFLDAWDSITNLTKTFQTSLFPGFHTRNAATGVFMNWLQDAFDPRYGPLNPMRYFRPYADAFALHAGQVIPDANKIPGLAHLSVEQATKQIADWGHTYGLTEARHGLFADLTGAGAHVAEMQPPVLPGSAKKGILESLQGAVPQTLAEANPLNTAGMRLPGMGGVNADIFAPARAGREIAGTVDEANRMSNFIAKLRQGYAPEAAALESKAAHYDYTHLTPFERQVMRRVIPFYCVPAHSDVLTRDGWKTCDTLDVGEEILTYNMAADSLEWQPCQAKHVFDHDQNLIVFESKRRKLEFTENHRWPVRVSAATVRHSYGTYTYPESRAFVEGADLKARHSLITNAEYQGTESVLTPEDARLVGWLVTDGTMRTKKNYFEALIYQSPKKFLAEVTAVAGSKPRKPHPISGVVGVNVEKTRKERVRPFCSKADLIKVVTRLSRAAAEAMYEAMYQAEGTYCKRGDFKHFAQQPGGVLEAFRVLAFLLGKRTSVPSKTGCYVSEKRFWKVPSSTISRQHYRGRVWCPQTANGTWVMRQNGVITITGNSWARHNTPAMLEHLFEEPGGKLASTIKFSGEARGREPGFTPEYLGEGLAAKIGGEDAQGTQRFLSHTGLPFEDLTQALSGRGLLGQLNPLIKAPLEQATGKQFFTGRDLADLHTMTGSQPLDQLLMNSPLGRLSTTARTLLDPRKEIPAKALNTLTGLHITDVQMPQARNVATRDFIDQQLRGNPAVRRNFDLSVNPAQFATLTPEDQLLYRLYRTQQMQARQAAAGR